MKSIIALSLVAVFSVSCMSPRDQEVYAEFKAEFFGSDEKVEAISEAKQEVPSPLEKLPQDKKDKKAEATPVEVN